MAVSTYALNLAADEVFNRTVSVRAHTGDPGSSGTANRITGASVDVLASGWTAASGGNVETNSATEFGTLSASSQIVVTHYSLFAGNNYIGSSALSSPVTVAANERFTINSGTIDFTIQSG